MPSSNDNKENPNPIVHTTQKPPHPSHLTTASLLGTSAIRRYGLGSSPSRSVDIEGCGDVIVDTIRDATTPSYLSPAYTAEERSVMLALSAAAHPKEYATNTPSSSTSVDYGTSQRLELLQQAGFPLFHPHRIMKQCKAIRFPSYAPSVNSQSTIKATETMEGKRDAITVNEIFDIVRNIQDPEHPLTLEQLNVVRLELIKVVDLKGGGGDGGLGDGMLAKSFSTVHVQFT